MINFAARLIIAWLTLSSAHAQFASISGPSFNISNVPTTTVSALPACSAANNGLVYRVTDALTPAVLSAPVGGGAVSTLVHCNGTIFVVG